MNATELILTLLQILLLILVLLFGIQVLRRLDHILKKLNSVFPNREDKETESDFDPLEYMPSYVIGELNRQRAALVKEDRPDTKEKRRLLEKFLRNASLQFADQVARVFINTDEEISLEKVLKGVFDIQFPHFNRREMFGSIEIIRGTQIPVERTLKAFVELGYLVETNGMYQVTELGRDLFESSLTEKIKFEEKFFALFSERKPLTPGCTDGRCVFLIQKNADDASEVSGGATCTFSTEDENIYLGECDGGQAITAGFRFVDVDIPSGATIEQAYLEFVADGPYTNSISLSIQGEDRGDVAAFSDSDQPKDRPMTTTYILWRLTSNEPWILGDIRMSPDISPIVQAIVNRPDWNQGNALAIFVKGIQGGDKGKHRRLIGFRRAHSSEEYDPPRLVVQFRLQ